MNTEGVDELRRGLHGGDRCRGEDDAGEQSDHALHMTPRGQWTRPDGSGRNTDQILAYFGAFAAQAGRASTTDVTLSRDVGVSLMSSPRTTAVLSFMAGRLNWPTPIS